MCGVLANWCQIHGEQRRLFLVSVLKEFWLTLTGLLVYWVGGHDPTSIPGVEMHGSPTTVQ